MNCNENIFQFQKLNTQPGIFVKESSGLENAVSQLILKTPPPPQQSSKMHPVLVSRLGHTQTQRQTFKRFTEQSST